MTVYNVTAKGASGNGSTDDTAAIQAAINDCIASSNGGIVYFPAGTYKITNPLNISMKNGCTLRGEGHGATFIKNSNRSSNAITFSGCAYSGVEDLAIYSDRTTGNPTGGVAIEFNNNNGNGNSYDNHVSNTNIGYCWNGIKVLSSTETLIEQVLIRGPYGSYGVFYGGTAGANNICYGMTATDLVVDTIDTGNTSANLFQMDSYANSLTIKRAALLQGGVGFVMADSAGQGAASRPQFAYVFDLECDHNQAGGVNLTGGTAFYLTGAFVGSCLAGNGVFIGSSYLGDVSITATRIAGNAQNGILINNGPKDITLGNCVIGLNGQQATNTFHGVFFNNSHTIITGCRVGGVNGATGQQRTGIFAQTSASNYIISSNDTTGNITAGISNNGTTPNSILANI